MEQCKQLLPVLLLTEILVVMLASKFVTKFPPLSETLISHLTFIAT